MRNAALLCRLAIGGAVLALAGGCNPRESKAAAAGRRSAIVSVAAVRSGPLVHDVVHLGWVRAVRQSPVSAEASGRLLSLEVNEGDRVQAGDVLARIDHEMAEARVASAQAVKGMLARQLQQALRDQKRSQKLGPQILPGAVIEQDLTARQTAQGRSRVARAAQRQAEAELDRHTVLAPFAGVIAYRWADVGTWVSTGDPIVELVDDDAIEVMVDGPRGLAQTLQPGDTAQLLPPADANNQAPVLAEVAGIAPSRDPVTKTVRVRLAIRGAAPWLMPGDPVDVAIQTVEIEPGALLVPRDALVRTAVGTHVVRTVDGQAERVAVDVVASSPDQVLVRDERLSEGDQVVVRGNERLATGQHVVPSTPN